MIKLIDQSIQFVVQVWFNSVLWLNNIDSRFQILKFVNIFVEDLVLNEIRNCVIDNLKWTFKYAIGHTDGFEIECKITEPNNLPSSDQDNGHEASLTFLFAHIFQI